MKNKTVFLTLEHYNKGITPIQYQRFLLSQREGKWLMFDPLFFFTQFFWLFYYKMYAEAMIYTCVISLLSSILFIDDHIQGVSFYISLLLSLGIAVSFFNMRLFQISLNRRIYQTRMLGLWQERVLQPSGLLRYIVTSVLGMWAMMLVFFFTNPVLIYILQNIKVTH